MLTQEEQQRIEAEECKRHAEERYRNDVRARLQHETASSGKAVPTTQPHNLFKWILLGIVGILIGSTIIANVFTGKSAAKENVGTSDTRIASAAAPIPKTRYVPVSQKIATGQIIVRAGGFVQYRITISPEMREPVLTGNFNASGGFGNDIAAVIADEMNFTNWINGHQAQVFWTTQGRETMGNFEVRLRPGQYYIVFSNKFSLMTDKQVFLDVDLNSNRQTGTIRTRPVVPRRFLATHFGRMPNVQPRAGHR